MFSFETVLGRAHWNVSGQHMGTTVQIITMLQSHCHTVWHQHLNPFTGPSLLLSLTCAQWSHFFHRPILTLVLNPCPAVQSWHLHSIDVCKSVLRLEGKKIPQVISAFL